MQKLTATNIQPAATTSDVVIRAAGLGKRCKIYPRAWGRLTEWFTGGSAVRHEDFWALCDVTFEVKKGESLGVLGVNGSGKATLLKILSGAMYPTEGPFDVKGRTLRCDRGGQRNGHPHRSRPGVRRA